MNLVRSLSKYFGKLLELMSRVNKAGSAGYPHQVREFFELFEKDDASQSFFGYLKTLDKLKRESRPAFDAHQLSTIRDVINEIDRNFSLDFNPLCDRLFNPLYDRLFYPGIVEQIDKTFPLNSLDGRLFPDSVKEGLMCLLFKHLFEPQALGNSTFLRTASLASKYLAKDLELGIFLILISFAIDPCGFSFSNRYETLARVLGEWNLRTEFHDELNEIVICASAFRQIRMQHQIFGEDIGTFVQNHSGEEYPRTFRVLLMFSLLNRVDEDGKDQIARKRLIPLDDGALDFVIRGFYDYDWRIFDPLPRDFDTNFIIAQLKHQPRSLSKIYSLAENLDLQQAGIQLWRRLPIFKWFPYKLNAEDRRALLNVCTEERIPHIFIQMLVWFTVLGDNRYDSDSIRCVKESTATMLSVENLVEDVPHCIKIHFAGTSTPYISEKQRECLDFALHSAIELFRRKDESSRDPDGLLARICTHVVSGLNKTLHPELTAWHWTRPMLVNEMLWLRGQVHDSTGFNHEGFRQLTGFPHDEAVRVCMLTAMCFSAMQHRVRPNPSRSWLRICPLRVLYELRLFL